MFGALLCETHGPGCSVRDGAAVGSPSPVHAGVPHSHVSSTGCGITGKYKAVYTATWRTLRTSACEELLVAVRKYEVLWGHSEEAEQERFNSGSSVQEESYGRGF